MSDMTQPDRLILKVGGTLCQPAVARRAAELVVSRFPHRFPEVATFGDLSQIPWEEVEAAIRGRGVSSEQVEDFYYLWKETRKWLLPLGERVPFDEEEIERIQRLGLPSDEEYEARRLNEVNEPRLLVKMAPAWLRTIRRLLRESEDPDAQVALEGLEKEQAFERADAEYRTRIEAEPPPTFNWVEKEGGYWVRVNDSYSPMNPVIRRWDADVGPFRVSIVRAYRTPVVGAYDAYLDLDDRAELIAADAKTFMAMEKKMLKALQARMPIPVKPRVMATGIPSPTEPLENKAKKEQV